MIIKNKKISHLDEQWYKKISFLICIAIFLLLTILTIKNLGTIVTEDATYEIIRKANFTTNQDPLVEKQVDIKADTFLTPLLNHMDYDIAIILLLSLLIMSTLILLYYLKLINYIFFIILSISPFFMRMSITYSEFSVILPLLIILVHLYDKNQFVLSYFIFLIITYLNTNIGLIIGIITIFLVKKQKQQNKLLILNYNITPYIKIKYIFFVFLFLPFIFLYKTILKNNFIEPKSIFERLIFDFGALNGIPIVIVLLGLISIGILWNKEEIVKLILISAIILLFIDINSGLFIINMIGIYLSSQLVTILIKEKWSTDYLKQLSVLLIICSILFSGLSYIFSEINNKESDEFYHSLLWINKELKNDSLILSHYKYGTKIKFFSNKAILLDFELEKIERGREKLNDSMNVFHSRNLNKTISILNKYTVTHILITSEMKNGLIWNKENEGLDFIMNNNDEFQLIYDNKEIKLWKYIQK
jgi:hypothetical protein